MEFEYTPEVDGFKGTVKLKLLTYKEKLQKQQDLGLKIDKNGEVVIEDLGKASSKLIENINKHIVNCNLSYDGVGFTSLDELGYYEEGLVVVLDIAKFLMRGPVLGKNLKQRSGKQSEETGKTKT